MDVFGFLGVGEPPPEKKKRKRPPGPEIPTIRLTVVGPASSGKTSLVDAIVNNCFYEKTKPTTEVEFYYRLYSYEVQKGLEKIQAGTALLEIEDTYPSNLKGDDRQIERLLHNMRDMRLLSKFRENIAEEKMEVQPFRVFSFNDFKKPCSMNRSAFLIVFDCNEMSSLKEAARVLNILKEQSRKLAARAMCPLPIIYMVGTKIDENSDEIEAIKQKAEEISDEKQVICHFVSALNYLGIEDLLNDVVNSIITTPGLWQIREELEESSEEFDSEDYLSSSSDDYK